MVSVLGSPSEWGFVSSLIPLVGVDGGPLSVCVAGCAGARSLFIVSRVDGMALYVLP